MVDEHQAINHPSDYRAKMISIKLPFNYTNNC